jgi:hypothetical protein
MQGRVSQSVQLGCFLCLANVDNFYRVSVLASNSSLGGIELSVSHNLLHPKGTMETTAKL